MQKSIINQIFTRFLKQNPNPTTELKFNSNFELLIAVMLSAQATDISVNLATDKLYKIANTPQQILDLGLNKLNNYIKSIGLHNTKAQNIIKTCQILLNNYNSEIPNTLQELIKLPGVGRKTANVILNTAFNKPTIAVDTHIFRVSKRIGLSNGKNVTQVEQDLLKIIPAKFKLNAHHWLILHGRYTCKARIPNCNNCIIADLCDFNKLSLVQK